jgi:hypothetical protein
MPEDIRTRILKVQEKSGFIPNVFLMLAYRPDARSRAPPARSNMRNQLRQRRLFLLSFHVSPSGYSDRTTPDVVESCLIEFFCGLRGR